MKQKCLMWKDGKCNSDYHKGRACDGLKPLGNCPYSFKQKSNQSQETKPYLSSLSRVHQTAGQVDKTPDTSKEVLEKLKSEWRAKMKRMKILSGDVAVFELENLIKLVLQEQKT